MKKFESLKLLTNNFIKHAKEFASNVAYDSTKKNETTNQNTHYTPSYEYVDEHGNNIIYCSPCNDKNTIKDEKNNFKRKLDELKIQWKNATWGLSYDLEFTIGACQLGTVFAVPVALGSLLLGHGVASLGIGVCVALPFLAYGLFADALRYYDDMHS